MRLADDAPDRRPSADADLEAGDLRGPLHGVPFTIKDSLDTAGVVTTAGTVGWRDRVPERDATVVARLKAAGAILVGKTNTPEFTWSDETDNDVYGRTSNPYDLERTPGGSSGGSAAIVAAGGSPFDIGSDTGDSIRQPAHVCGIAGLKPTSGRVPAHGSLARRSDGLFQSFTQLGPIARRVEDLELLLPILAGPDGVDPHIAPVPLGDPPLRSTRRAPRRPLHRQRHPNAHGRDDRGGRSRRAAPWPRAGARVEDGVPPDLAGRLGDVGRADPRRWVRLAPAADRERRHARVRARTPAAGWVTPRAADRRATRCLRWSNAPTPIRSRAPGAGSRDVDLIVCPAMPQPAIRHGESTAEWFGDTYSDVHNLTGWPALVVRGGTVAGTACRSASSSSRRPGARTSSSRPRRVVEAASGGWQAPPF